jgi:hypothetical protein
MLDARSGIAKALRAWRGDLIAHLGGPETITPTQESLVDLCVRSKLMLDSIDAWLLARPSLVNARTRSVYPVVLQRQQLADALARHLQALGLERRAPKAPSLDEYLQRYPRPGAGAIEADGSRGSRGAPPSPGRGAGSRVPPRGPSNDPGGNAGGGREG